MKYFLYTNIKNIFFMKKFEFIIKIKKRKKRNENYLFFNSSKNSDKIYIILLIKNKKG